MTQVITKKFKDEYLKSSILNSIKSIELQVLGELDSTRVTIFFKQLKNYDDMIGRF
jgi:hypothetical protein